MMHWKKKKKMDVTLTAGKRALQKIKMNVTLTVAKELCRNQSHNQCNSLTGQIHATTSSSTNRAVLANTLITSLSKTHIYTHHHHT